MIENQCGDPDCTEEHGDEPDPADSTIAGNTTGTGYRPDMAIYDASLHYRNGQR